MSDLDAIAAKLINEQHERLKERLITPRREVTINLNLDADLQDLFNAGGKLDALLIQLVRQNEKIIAKLDNIQSNKSNSGSSYGQLLAEELLYTKTDSFYTILERFSYKVDIDSITDGDTIKAKVVYLPYNIALTDISLRAANYDTWESRLVNRSTGPKVDAEEIRKGKLAAEELKILLSGGELKIIPAGKGDFSRYDAYFFIKKDEKYINVKKYMEENQHIRK